MFQITINEKGGQQRLLEFDKSEITIGRVQGNDIVLPKGNISKRHSRIVVKDGKFIIIDMQSTNGTYVNGKKITTPQVVKSTDKIYIGDFTLQLTGNGAADAKGGAAAKGKSPAGDDELDLGDGNGADSGAKPKAGSPGLIDDNFDQEFAGTSEPEPAPKSATKKAAKVDDDVGELDLDLDRGAAADAGGDALDDEPKAPVVPLKKPVPESKKAAAIPTPAAAPAAARAAAGPSKVKPAPAPPLPAAKPKPAARTDEMDEPGDAGERATGSPPGLPMPPGAAMGGAVYAAGPATPPLDHADAVRTIHHAVVEELGLAGVELKAVAEHKDAVQQAARKIAERMRATGRIFAGEDLDAMARDVAKATADFEPIQDLIADDAVHEIVITHQREVWVDRDGQLAPAERTLGRESEVVAMIQRVAMLAGVQAGAEHPLVDARLRDGSRVVASLPPLAFRGPTLSIRKSSRDAYSLDDLLRNQNLSESMKQFIDTCIRYKKGILLSVGPGVSASATLNALASVVPADERVVTVERDVELHLGHTNVTALEPSNEVGLAQLIRHAVALKPDRALIGVVSGAGVFEVLTAMGGPLEGGIFCYAASTPEQAIERLVHSELSDKVKSLEDARRLVGAAVTVVLQEQRFADGSRRITQISELVPDGENLGVQDVFLFEPGGLDDKGLVTGEFKPTGYTPRFCEELNERGLEVNMGMFQA